MVFVRWKQDRVDVMSSRFDEDEQMFGAHRLNGGCAESMPVCAPPGKARLSGIDRDSHLGQ